VSIDREEAIKKYDSSLVRFDDSFLDPKPENPSISKQNSDVWKLLITHVDGKEFYTLAEIGKVYLMSDAGDTVDKF